MEMQPTYIIRLAAAFKAVRLIYSDRAPSSQGDPIGAKYLAIVIGQLEEDGLSEADLKPLKDLEASFCKPGEMSETDMRADRRSSERRDGGAPSQTLLARLTAVIDLLVKGGYDESDAAQTLMRRLLVAGVPPPLQGGDARGWKRMLFWRADFSHGLATPEAKAEYRDFNTYLETIPAQDRIQRVLDEHLWDRRRNPR